MKPLQPETSLRAGYFFAPVRPRPICSQAETFRTGASIFPNGTIVTPGGLKDKTQSTRAQAHFNWAGPVLRSVSTHPLWAPAQKSSQKGPHLQ